MQLFFYEGTSSYIPLKTPERVIFQNSSELLLLKDLYSKSTKECYSDFFVISLEKSLTESDLRKFSGLYINSCKGV